MAEQKEDGYKPKSIYLKEIPKDVYDILIEEQAYLKKRYHCQRSLSTTIYSIIKKHKRDAETEQ